MISKTKQLILAIVIPLAIGGLSALISGGGMEIFEMVNKPPLSPPGFLFPVVWTFLYILMGISSYLIYTSDADSSMKSDALKVYFLQLAVNFFWSILFFNFNWYLFSFVWLVLLWVLILLMIKKFQPVSKVAAYLQIPYLVWVTFAGYLTLGIYLLNR